ncbi:hypothetical protein HOV93_39390 [Planctomycetes bacterium FF15]|uniref:Uncharacterized protein n=1 Tax=Bremerella alba TaxID=980252 RepID=A0A7V9A8T1_9BACT|nr:hypothetical protein [Bremerella alba]
MPLLTFLFHHPFEAEPDSGCTLAVLLVDWLFACIPT